MIRVAKVVLGLSGGVDSAVAASLLAQDYEVICVWLSIGPAAAGEKDAAASARYLGLPFERVDISQALEQHVCAPFAAAYCAGRTPIPCAVCNPMVKFPALLAAADRLGADYVATGHYAATERGADGRALLRRGSSANDQSYLLSRLPQQILSRALFPLGPYEKQNVRAIAKDRGLPAADKPDSMEICFIPDGDYAAWLERRGAVPPPGDFVDRNGHILGRHRGIHHYTLGQGRGLGISGPHRYYISAIDPVRNQVVLSDGTDLFADLVRCHSPNWISIPALDAPRTVTVRLRHSRTETPALLYPVENGVEIHTTCPVRAPTPGQMAVFYDGDLVLGSAWIDSSNR